jgi:hypothetical protein
MPKDAAISRVDPARPGSGGTTVVLLGVDLLSVLLALVVLEATLVYTVSLAVASTGILAVSVSTAKVVKGSAINEFEKNKKYLNNREHRMIVLLLFNTDLYKSMFANLINFEELQFV